MEEWNSGKEIEGELNASKMIATLSQFEKMIVDACGPVVKMKTREQLCARKA